MEKTVSWRDGHVVVEGGDAIPGQLYDLAGAYHADGNTRDPPLPHLTVNVAIDIVSWCGCSRCRGAGGRPTTAETEAQEEGLTCHWPRPPAPG